MSDIFFTSLISDVSETNDSFDTPTIESSLKGLNIRPTLTDKFKDVVSDITPTINGLMDNTPSDMEANEENLILLTLTVLGITNLEEIGNSAGHPVIECPKCKGTGCDKCNNKGEMESVIDKNEAQSLLEELRMRGVGNGTVKKLVQAMITIGEFSKELLSDTEYSVDGFISMLDKKNVLSPMMNSMKEFIKEFGLNVDSLQNNLSSLKKSVNSYVSKKGIDWLLDKLKSAFGEGIIKDKISDGTDILNSDTTDNVVNGNNLIKEQ